MVLNRSIIQIYKKIYDCEIPTKEKINNVKIIDGVLREVFVIAKADSKVKNWRLSELLEIVKTKYDEPGDFQIWLLKAVKEVYQSGYGERRG